MLANEIINRLILLAKGKSELKYDDIFEAKFIKSIPEKEARTIFKSIIDTAGLPATVTAITMPSPTTADARIQFEKNEEHIFSIKFDSRSKKISSFNIE